ncbi:hypothetical protein ACA910_011098 [Epithemia clementina (nom. ined.)]
MYNSVLLLLVSVSLFPKIASSEEVLRQVLVVTRHGSRLPLRKDGQDLSESTPGMLTALGQLQLYEVGQYLYSQYNSSGLFTPFDRSKVLLQSSSYERTITSANSLALGLFNEEARDPNSESQLPVIPANIPVYTFDLVNDVLIRAYDKCPTYEKRLNDLYTSAEWTAIENDNTELLVALSRIPDFESFTDDRGFVPLSELWNVFDLVNVAETECGTTGEPSAACKSLTTSSSANVNELLTASEWQTVQELSHKAEIMKYGFKVADRFIGANLLAEIADRMQKDDYTFSLFSAHYPTLLGIMAALGDDFFDDEVIPSYGAALVFEVTQDTTTGIRYFKLTYVADELPDNTAGKSMKVPFDNICTDAASGSSCPVSDLVNFLGGWNVTRWCTECENDSANVCMRIKLEAQDGSGDGDSVNDNGNDDGNLPPVLTFIIGLAVGVAAVLVAVVCTNLAKARRTRREQQQQQQNGDAMGKTDDTTDLGMIAEDNDNIESNNNNESNNGTAAATVISEPNEEKEPSPLAVAAQRPID